MSIEAFETVIGKAVLEAAFRDALLADPDQALAGYELTEQEIHILKCIDGETIEVVGHMLDARVSQIKSAEDPAEAEANTGAADRGQPPGKEPEPSEGNHDSSLDDC
jgi:hypothetical protein